MTDLQQRMWYAHGPDGDFGPFVGEPDASAWVEEEGGAWEIRPLTQTPKIMFLFWRSPPGADSPEALAFMRNIRDWNRSWFDQRDTLP